MLVRPPEGFVPARDFPSGPLTVSLQIAQRSLTPRRDISYALLQLRRILLLALGAVIFAVPAGTSATLERPSGSVYLQFLDGAGTARVRPRGNFLGRVGRGRIVASRNVHLGGCESRRRLADGLKECRGTGLTFRTPSDARWRLRLHGRTINATGFVRGCMVLNGVNRGDPGQFRIGDTLRDWPRTATRYRLGRGC